MCIDFFCCWVELGQKKSLEGGTWVVQIRLLHMFCTECIMLCMETGENGVETNASWCCVLSKADQLFER